MMGEAEGTIPLIYDPASGLLQAADDYAAPRFAENGYDLLKEMPNFHAGLLDASHQALVFGQYARMDMPVIEDDDLDQLEAFIASRLGGSVTKGRVMAKHVRPTQTEIWVDKSVDNTAKRGGRATIDYLQSKHIVTSRGHSIFDGHHRWLSAMLIDPELELPHYRINLPAPQVLVVLDAFSDSKGRDRNA